MYAIRVETLDYKETAVVLAIAINYFDINKKLSLNELTKTGLLVKLNVKEQVKKYKRTILNDVIEYWKKQELDIKKLIFIPSEHDLFLTNALSKIDEYVKKNSSWKDFFWVDGYFSWMVYNNLAKNANTMPLLYNNVRDFKTAYDLLETKEYNEFLDEKVINSKDSNIVNVRNILKLISNN